MGTSSSSKGGRGKNPLVPDWADDQPGAPLPEPDANRYRSFRTSFGDYLSGGGGRSALEKSLGKFANKATGGSTVGPRRLGKVIVAGGAFAEALRDISQGQQVDGLDGTNYTGKSVEQFSQAIAEIVCGDSPDADWINSAIQEAVEAVLDFDADFDPNSLTEDNIVAIMIEFLAQSIFQLVLTEAGNSWNRSKDIETTVKCEGEILDLTREHIEQSYGSQIEQNGLNFDSNTVQNYMRATARQVWETWERFDD